MSFEKSIERIDEIISLLENGELPLEKAVELYTEGVSAAAECKKQLDGAKLKLSRINPETGEIVTEEV
ncbi:MAG: exodeoxyribonuclease VII small subunit [Ruminococcus sp.]|nr:exodeoxyribonuclease VII small subunit [Ruminococcus sp.]